MCVCVCRGGHSVLLRGISQELEEGVPWWSSGRAQCFHCWGLSSIPGLELGSHMKLLHTLAKKKKKEKKFERSGTEVLLLRAGWGWGWRLTSCSGAPF